MNLRRRAIMGIKKSRLPKEYQEVEYLESTGTQYIDTRIVPNTNTSMECEIAATQNTEQANWNGSVLKGNWGWFAVGDYGSDVGLVAFFSVNARAGVVIPQDTYFHKYYISNGLQKIDDIVEHNFVDLPSYMVSIWLFRGHNTYNGYTETKNKIKFGIIYEGGEVVCNLVPCYRKSDNKPGMYDLVTKTFFTNQGTGDFIVGADVN